MDGTQIVAFAPFLAIILCASLGNCWLTRGLRSTIQSLEQRLQTLESVRATPQVILTSTPRMALTSTPRVALTPPPQLPPIPSVPQTYPQPPPSSYYYPQQPYMNPAPSAPRTSSII